jgi:hypothetical protein
MSAPDHFELLQDKIIARLAAYKDSPNDPKPFLQDTANDKTIEVFDERIGDLGNKIDRALGTGLGIAVVVMTPVSQLRDPDQPGLDLLALVKVQIQENVTLNRGNSGTKVSAMKVRNMAMRAIHHWPHLLYTFADKLQRVQLEKIPYVLVKTDPLVYDVDATTPLNLSAPLRA